MQYSTQQPIHEITRRSMLKTTAVGALATFGATLVEAKPSDKQVGLQGEVGLTTGSFMPYWTVERQRDKLRLLDLPKLMRDELGMRVLDVMTACFASFEPKYLDELRERSEKAGCIITNLKMNQKEIDIGSSDKEKRAHALKIFKQTIDSAERLGCRWVRPRPVTEAPHMPSYIDSYRQLIDYAAPKGISLLIENNGWMRNDPDAIPNVIREVGKGLAACPDTGNWDDAARDDGLAKSFPLAVTCDYKAFQLGPNNEHERYDLRRCFDIGWKAGFRGPWCLEHFNDDFHSLLKGFVYLRETLEKWMKEAGDDSK